MPLCEFFSSNHDPILALLRTLEKHPNKDVKGAYYYRNYLIFELT